MTKVPNAGFGIPSDAPQDQDASGTKTCVPLAKPEDELEVLDEELELELELELEDELDDEEVLELAELDELMRPEELDDELPELGASPTPPQPEAASRPIIKSPCPKPKEVNRWKKVTIEQPL